MKITKNSTFEEYAKNFFIDSTYTRRQKNRGNILKDATLRFHQTRLRLHLLPTLGEYKISELSLALFENTIYALPYSSKTKQCVSSTARIILKELKRDGLINFDIEYFEAPKAVSQTPRILEHKNFNRLFPENEVAFKGVWRKPDIGIMCAIMLSAGLRISEARALLVSDVLKNIPAISITKQIDQDKKVAPPKAGSTRVVLIPERTLEMIKSLPPFKQKNKDALLFPKISRDGTPRYYTSNEIAIELNYAVRKARLHYHLTLHALRHSYTTRMNDLFFASKISNSTELAVLMYFLGHKSEKITKHYDHGSLFKRTMALCHTTKEIINKFW